MSQDEQQETNEQQEQHETTDIVQAAPLSITKEEEELEAQVAFQTIKRRREERKRRRIIIIVALSAVALVALIVFIAARVNQASKTSEVDPFSVTGDVYVGDFQNTVKVNGATEPRKSTIVSPEVDGIIENLQVSEGDVVNEGDVLFTIKNTDIDKAIRDADSAVESAQSNVDKANRAVDEAYNAYNNAVNLYNASGGEMPFDEDTLRSAITSAEDSYNDMIKALEAAQNSRNETLEKADKRTVRAPASGTLVSLSAVDGASVSAGTIANGSTNRVSVAQIADLSQLKATVQVNEADISSIQTGQQGTATFSAIPGLTLPITVQHISSISSGSADGSSGSTGSSSVVTYAVDLVIPDPDPRIKPGMTASANIVTQGVQGATIVPTASLVEDENGGYQVIVVDNAAKQEVHTVPVEVIAKNSSEAAIKGDLKDGDKVMLTSAAMSGSASSGTTA